MTIIALITGGFSLLNYCGWASGIITGNLRIISLILQGMLLVLTAIAVFGHSGSGTKKEHRKSLYKNFNLQFAVTVLSLIGNLCVFFATVFYTLGVIKQL